MTGNRETTTAELIDQLHALGVTPGGVLIVHTSFRAVRPVERGPHGLIDALQAALGPDGTLVMPSWTGDSDSVFDPTETPADPDLGVTADLFWQRPDVVRSDHCFAFAASGPKAEKIVSGPLPLPPHIPDSPIGHVHDVDGQILLLGVNHDANTTIHLAEILADVPYRIPYHVTVMRNGQPTRVDYGENDHCCQRFNLVDDWLRNQDLQVIGPVGAAEARLMRSRDVVRVVSEHLTADPLLFLHASDEGCEECDIARSSLDASPWTAR
jgi:aminoglycoside 3-N-acetyltransferase